MRRSVDELARHRVDRDSPYRDAEQHERAEPGQVGPPDEAERSVADELDAMMERIEVGEELGPVREPVEREERAGHEKQRGEDRADDVAEVLDRLRKAGDRDPEAPPAE